MPSPTYGIFEGGGAKGLAHIAGAAAAERNGIQFIGVAGASAGALVASLLAVGYKAVELFDPNNPAANLLGRHQITPLSLLDLERWKSFEKARAQAGRAATAVKWGGGVAAWLFAKKATDVAREIERDGGYFGTELIREQLNYFLRTKLTQHHADAARDVEVPERVRFCDMSPSIAPECCSLKVIVTDVTNRRMIVFDNSDEYQNVEVAEAVAASISIPFVFKPARIPSYDEQPDALYADGGMVSNLPIWVFAEEKLNYERSQMPKSRVPVLAFSLVEPELQPTNAPMTAGAFTYLSNVARSAIFGGQAVATRFVADLVPVPMPIGLETTQFDFAIRTAIDEYHRAYAKAAKILGMEIWVRPEEAKKILKTFYDEVANTISNGQSRAAIKHLRVCIIEKFGASSFRVVQSYNTENDADDRLVFSNAASGAPDAFKGRAPAFLNLTSPWASGGLANMTKYEFALIRKGLHSAICFPIFADVSAWQETDPRSRPEPVGVVSIDSDEDLEPIYEDRALLRSLAMLTLPLSAVLT